jgi:phosphocarrier protein
VAAKPKGQRRRAARRTVTVVNRLGLHARAAAKFVKTAGAFNAKVTVARKSPDGEGERVPGDSIMGLMMLAAGSGTKLLMRAQGSDALPVLDALARLVAGGFEED